MGKVKLFSTVLKDFEYYCLLGCHAVPSGKNLPIFRRHVLVPPSGYHKLSQRNYTISVRKSIGKWTVGRLRRSGVDRTGLGSLYITGVQAAGSTTVHVFNLLYTIYIGCSRHKIKVFGEVC
jgi:hypothetical protein